MPIPMSGQFDYSAVVHRSSEGTWRGQAEDSTDRFHPGLARNRSHVTIHDGLLRLRPSEWRIWALANLSDTTRVGTAAPSRSAGRSSRTHSP